MADQIPAALTPTEDLTPDQMPAQLGSTPIASTTGQISGDSLPLYDHKNNTILTVPHAEAEPYLKSGQFTLPKNARINIINQDTGEAASVEGKEAYNALQSGYRLETAQETHDRRLQEQYGGPLEQAKAGVEGLERGMTFGISDQYRTATGEATGEQLASRQEANPVTSYGGEGVGMLSSLPAIGPVGELAEGATAKALLKGAERAGLTNPIARSIVGKIVPAAAGSAVEGAFYGAGQLLSEDALGKADLNAENLAAYIGTGALLNGAFGMAFSGAAELAGPLGKATKYVTSPFTSKISDELDSKLASAKMLGLSPAQLYKQEQRTPGLVDSMGDFLRDKLKLQITDTPETLFKKSEMLHDAAGTEIGSVLKEVDETLNQMPIFKPTAESVSDSIYKDVYKSVEDKLDSSNPFMEEYQKPINSFLDKVKRLGETGKTFDAGYLQKLKLSLDDMIKYEKTPGKFSILEELAYTARTAVKGEIDKLAQSIESLGGADDLAQRLKTANADYHATSVWGEFLEKKALKSGDSAQTTLTGIAKDVALDLKRKFLVLGKIEQGRQMIDKAITGTVKAFGTSTRGLSIASQMSVPSIAKSALAIDYSGEKPKKPRDEKTAYNNVLKNINSYAASPTAFMEKSNRQTASLYSAAPQTSAQLDNLAMTAMAYLSTKVPRSSHDATLLSAYQPVALPSTQALAKFARILEAVEKPAVVLKNLQNGTASREEMNVLKEVYPATFQKLQEKFMSELPHLQAEMPYNRRVQMGLLLGVPADLSMQPQNVLGLQALFGEAQAQQSGQSGPGGAVKSTAKGLGELSKSETIRTPLQEVQERSNDV